MNKTVIEFFATEFVGAKSLSYLARDLKCYGCVCQWSSKELIPSCMKGKLVIEIPKTILREDLKRVQLKINEMLYSYHLIVNERIRLDEYNAVNVDEGIVKTTSNDFNQYTFRYLKREGLCCRMNKRLIPIHPICSSVFVPDDTKFHCSLIARDMTDDVIGYICPAQMKKASRIEIETSTGEVKLIVNYEDLIRHTHSRICELFEDFGEFIEGKFASLSFHTNANCDLSIIDDIKTAVSSLHLFEIMLYHIGKQMVPKTITEENAMYWLRFWKSDNGSLPSNGDEIRTLQKQYSKEVGEELDWEGLANYIDKNCHSLAYSIVNVIHAYPRAVAIDFDGSILIHPATRNDADDLISYSDLNRLMKSDFVHSYEERVSLIIRPLTIEIRGNKLETLYNELSHLITPIEQFKTELKK